MDPEAQKSMDMLSKKSGKDFDMDYMNMMVKDHKKDIGEYQKASGSLSDATFKNFATTTLPVLQKHLDSAMAITKGH